MKFSCDQSEFAKALKAVGRGVPSRTTVPVLMGIRIVAEKGKVTFTATNLDLTIEKTIEADVEEDGVTVLPGTLLINIGGKLPNEIVTVASVGNEIEIKTENSNFNLKELAVNEFPNTDEDYTNESITFSKDVLTSMIKGTGFAASDDPSRKELCGILVDVSDGEATFVAIDGFRLAMRKESVETKDKYRFLVPATSMAEICMIDNGSEEVSVSFADSHAAFYSGDTTIKTRLLDSSSYIKWEEIVPKSSATITTICTDELMDSLVRASLFTEGKNNLVKFNTEKKTLHITSQSEIGNADERVAVKQDGPDILVGFNSKYLLDAIKVIDDEIIKMSFGGSTSPATIEPMDNGRFLYMVLPVRI